MTHERIDKKLLGDIANKVLKGENKKLDISIAIIGEKEIKGLNKKYRRINKPTDVLSFFYPPAGEAGGESGEIVICLKQVKINKEKLVQALIHGILHLSGYDHEKSVAAAKIMAKKENHYLSVLNIK